MFITSVTRTGREVDPRPEGGMAGQETDAQKSQRLAREKAKALQEKKKLEEAIKQKEKIEKEWQKKIEEIKKRQKK